DDQQRATAVMSARCRRRQRAALQRVVSRVARGLRGADDAECDSTQRGQPDRDPKRQRIEMRQLNLVVRWWTQRDQPVQPHPSKENPESGTQKSEDETFSEKLTK